MCLEIILNYYYMCMYSYCYHVLQLCVEVVSIAYVFLKCPNSNDALWVFFHSQVFYLRDYQITPNSLLLGYLPSIRPPLYLRRNTFHLLLILPLLLLLSPYPSFPFFLSCFLLFHLPLFFLLLSLKLLQLLLFPVLSPLLSKLRLKPSAVSLSMTCLLKSPRLRRRQSNRLHPLQSLLLVTHS